MKIKFKSTFVYFLLFGLAAACMVIFPFLGIWSINALFGFSIAYSWKNWVAAVVLLVLFKSSLSFGK